MTATDIGFWVTTVAAAVAAIYAGLSYHRPKTAVMSALDAPPSRRRLWPVIALALVAWGAAGFSYYDRHYLPPVRPGQQAPLSADNARLEVSRWESGVPNTNPPGDKHIVVNAYISNVGKAPAVGMLHAGFLMVATGGIPEAKLKAFFAFLHAEIEAISPASNFEIQPGNNNFWFSVPAVPTEMIATTDDLTAGKSVYVVNIMKYRDETTPSYKYIYTESCAYFVAGVVHVCDTGQN